MKIKRLIITTICIFSIYFPCLSQNQHRKSTVKNALEITYKDLELLQISDECSTDQDSTCLKLFLKIRNNQTKKARFYKTNTLGNNFVYKRLDQNLLLLDDYLKSSNKSYENKIKKILVKLTEIENQELQPKNKDKNPSEQQQKKVKSK